MYEMGLVEILSNWKGEYMLIFYEIMAPHLFLLCYLTKREGILPLILSLTSQMIFLKKKLATCKFLKLCALLIRSHKPGQREYQTGTLK